MFPHKIQKLRAYILQKLLVMVVAVANKNVLLHAYMDPQIFQMVWKNGSYIENIKLITIFITYKIKIIYPTASAMFGAHAGVLRT